MVAMGESLTKSGAACQEPDPFFRALLLPGNQLSVVNYNHVAGGPNWGYTRRSVPEHLIYFLKTGAMDAQFHDAPSGKDLLRIKGPALLWA